MRKNITISDSSENPTYYSYDCLQKYLSGHAFKDIYPRSFENNSSKRIEVIDTSVKYCLALPQKQVNSNIINDEGFITNLD